MESGSGCHESQISVPFTEAGICLFSEKKFHAQSYQENCNSTGKYQPRNNSKITEKAYPISGNSVQSKKRQYLLAQQMKIFIAQFPSWNLDLMENDIEGWFKANRRSCSLTDSMRMNC